MEHIPPVDCIIHLAGKAHDTNKQANAQDYFDINTGLTKQIFDWFLTTNGSKFIFFSSAKAATNQVDGELNGELNFGQNSVYQCIKKHEGRNAGQLSQELNMPFSTVDKHIRVFIKINLIERRGSRKTGGYFLLNNKIND